MRSNDPQMVSASPLLAAPQRFRIVFLSTWHSEKMGYSTNCLPKALAGLGHEVHLVTSNAQVYFNSPLYTASFEAFLGERLVECGIYSVDGFTVHRLPLAVLRGRVGVRGLWSKLRELKPQVVQAVEYTTVVTYQAALAKPVLAYRFFVECHIHASVFTPPWEQARLKRRAAARIYPWTIGRFVGQMCDRCYPISRDAAEIAIRFLGAPARKVSVRSLGVDTDRFRPPTDGAAHVRAEMRRRLGFGEEEIVCIYTGRFSHGKDPILLAQAISRLRSQGLPFRGLLVGGGTAEDVAALAGYDGCVVRPFVPVDELPALYWAADVGVWPRQESTSQLDAAACGLPLVLSNRVRVLERVDGNGLLYEEGNVEDLSKTLCYLADPDIRRRMGEVGARRIRDGYSWRRIAEEYVRDYARSLETAPASPARTRASAARFGR